MWNKKFPTLTIFKRLPNNLNQPFLQPHLLTCQSNMPKPRWTTAKQRSWLEERIPAFHDAQDNGLTTKVFYPELYAAWDRAFNPVPPSEIEIMEADGNLEKAIALKKKFMETVSLLFKSKKKNPTDRTAQTYRGSLNGFIIQRAQWHQAAKVG